MATVSVLSLLKVRSLARSVCLLPSLLNKNCKQSTENLSILKCFSSISDKAIAKAQNPTDANVSQKSKKKDEELKITLFLPDNSIIITDLENANKISKRRGLALIKVEDVQKKTIRPTYKLIRQAQQFEEDLEDQHKKEEDVTKAIKTIHISSKITIHDMNIKIKHANKLLEKKHKVKIILMNGSPNQDKIIKAIEVNTRNYGTIQKTTKPANMIFTLTPHLKGTDSNNSSNDNLNETRKEPLNFKST